MTEIGDEQRAQIYRELADAMDRTGNFYDQADLRQKADELDSPDIRWLRSLPGHGPSRWFDQAHHYLGCWDCSSMRLPLSSPGAGRWASRSPF